ncbi:MAG: fused response regulator/phosphatase [Magnetococcus sp. DMHC-6]
MRVKPEIFKILIIDDDPFDIDILRKILEKEYVLNIAINGHRGLQMARQASAPDLILLDVMMPDIDGYQVCRQLKSQPETEQIPIIFITAKSTPEDETMGLELGAIDYIIKPFTPSVVQARIKPHLALHMANRKLAELNARLLEEREVIEDIVANMQRFRVINTRHLRCLNIPLEKTSGDMLLAEFRPDGGQHILLGDFTGHGLTAAIAGPLVAHIFYDQTHQGSDMEKICAELNRKLYHILRRDMYMVCGLLEITPDRTQLRVWNCGMDEILLVRAGKIWQKIDSELFPRGVMDRPDKPPQIVDLHPGDRVFVYSDGMIEAQNPQKEEFGKERLFDLLQQVVVQNHPLEIVLQALEAFRCGGERKDDLTLLEWTC